MIEIEVTKQLDVSEWEAALLGGVEDAMPGIESALLEAADRCFETSTDPWGKKWRDLADSTLLARGRRAAGPSRRRVRFVGPLNEGQRGPTRSVAWTRRRSERASRAIFGAKPLIDRGALRGSLAGKIDGTTVRVGPGGAAAVYAAAQQFGYEQIPPRPYLPIHENGEVEMPEALRAEMIETIRDAIRLRIGRQR